MEQAIEDAVVHRNIPGCALLAADKAGGKCYAKCFGRRGIGDEEKPMTMDTVMRFASATKLITSVAALQCVEKGLLELDGDISKVLPELGSFQVLTGFDPTGQPELRPPTRSIALKHLLSHSSGLSYDAASPLLVKYREWQGIKLQPDFETVAERFTYPLVFDPGEGWSYSPGLEWTGKVIEKATGLTLNEYVQRNIAAPLAIRDMSFKLQSERPDMLQRRATSCDRDADGHLHAGDNEFWHKDFQDDFGGMGIFTTPADYFKVLQSLLVNDGKILKPETVDLLFQPQLSPQGVAGMKHFYTVEAFAQPMGHAVPKGLDMNHALGGSLMMQDSDGPRWRRKGTMVWAGLPNIIWAIDREAGICTLYASQVRPPGDPTSIKFVEMFERDIYAQVFPFVEHSLGSSSLATSSLISITDAGK